jgi:hypothetical protein
MSIQGDVVSRSSSSSPDLVTRLGTNLFGPDFWTQQTTPANSTTRDIVSRDNQGVNPERLAANAFLDSLQSDLQSEEFEARLQAAKIPGPGQREHAERAIALARPGSSEEFEARLQAAKIPGPGQREHAARAIALARYNESRLRRIPSFFSKLRA